MKTKDSDMVNVQNIIDIYFLYKWQFNLVALVVDILPLLASLSPYVTCVRAPMETLGIFSPSLNDFKSNRSHIKLVCFIYVHFEVHIISAISQLTVEDRLRRSY